VPFRHSLLTGRQQRVPHFETKMIIIVKIRMILGGSASQTHRPRPGAGFGNGVAKPATRVLVAAAPSMTSPPGVRFNFALLQSVVHFCSAPCRTDLLTARTVRRSKSNRPSLTGRQRRECECLKIFSVAMEL
jgi:hypothetical protein